MLLHVGGGGGGGFATPYPVNTTVLTPRLSSTLRIHPPVARPMVFGVNRIDSTRLDPAAMVVPSGSVVRAVNSPLSGGFDLENVRLLPPTSVNLNFSVTECPTVTFRS